MKNTEIGVVIPCYNSPNSVLDVLEKMPQNVGVVILVEDGSTDPVQVNLAQKKLGHAELVYIPLSENSGVGAAMKKGLEKAKTLDVDCWVKVDADDQMDLDCMPLLTTPILQGAADFAKGNRFCNRAVLSKMPKIRLFGNLIISFLIKGASGYWNVFDPTNGYFAISTDLLNKLDSKYWDNGYFFESSLLASLYFEKATVKEVCMEAQYGENPSHMVVWRMPFLYLTKALKTGLRRIVKTYFLHDFNLVSLYLCIGVPLMIVGMLFGLYNWIWYATQNIPSPTGTIILPTLAIILGFQLLLQAVHFDVLNTPGAKPSGSNPT